MLTSRTLLGAPGIAARSDRTLLTSTLGSRGSVTFAMISCIRTSRSKRTMRTMRVVRAKLSMATPGVDVEDGTCQHIEK